MSSLKERVAARLKQAESDPSLPPRCVSAYPASKDLIFINEEGKCWHLPWSCLQYCSAVRNGESFHLSFTTHEVWLYGKHLAELSQPLAKRAIASIMAVGSENAHRTRPGQPFVEKITVSEKGKI